MMIYIDKTSPPAGSSHQTLNCSPSQGNRSDIPLKKTSFFASWASLKHQVAGIDGVSRVLFSWPQEEHTEKKATHAPTPGPGSPAPHQNQMTPLIAIVAVE